VDEPSYYVSANGDDSNDGLSEDRPMRSLWRTFYMARDGDIKKITVIGTLNKDTEDDPGKGYIFELSFTEESEEIFITGKPGASGNERAVLSGRGSGVGVLTAFNNAKIRFEHIEISGGEGEGGVGFLINKEAQVTLGPDAVVRGNSRFGIIIDNGTCDIDGGEVRDNANTGIVVIEKGVLTMRSGAIRDNRSTNDAGGVFIANGGRFTMSGGTITGNSAAGAGGGVAVDSGGRFDQTGGTIIANTAPNGANVYRDLSSLGSNPTPGTSSQAGASSVSYYVSARGNDSNDGLSEDRPIRTLLMAISIAQVQEIKRITVIGTLDATSEKPPESLPLVFGLVTVVESPEIIITGKPGASGTERAVLSGRGSGASVLGVTNNTKIRFEHIEISGGEGEYSVGLQIGNGAQVTLGPGAVVQGNSVMGIGIIDGTCVIDGGEVRDNAGPGIAVGEKGVLTMRSGAIRDNRSTGNGGGVGILSGGRFTMSGGTITGNRAAGAGGGVYVASGGTFNQTGGTISGNTATQGSNPNVYREQGALGSNPTPGGTSSTTPSTPSTPSTPPPRPSFFGFHVPVYLGIYGQGLQLNTGSLGAGLGVKGAVVYMVDNFDMEKHIKSTYTRAALIFCGTYKFSLFAEYYHKDDPLFTYDNWNKLENWGFGIQWGRDLRD
jgi:hypothetical protein